MGLHGDAMNQDFLSSSKKWDWETPASDFDKINKVFGFRLDAAATKENSKCPEFITPEMDAFTIEWEPSPWFLNPPWGKEYTDLTGRTMLHWIYRIKEQVLGKHNAGVLLCAARTDTQWWQEASSFCDYVLFPDHRIAYEDRLRDKPSQPTFPSCYIIYYPLDPRQVFKLKNIGLLVKRV